MDHVRGNPMPDAFECVVCQCEVQPNRWHWQREHKPPVCFYCSNTGGHQVRIPGMTRGDHRTLQRLVAVANALEGAAWMEAHRGRFTAV